MDIEHVIMLKDVRCSFPHFFKRPIINGDEGSYGTTLLLEPGPQVDKVKNEVKEVLKEKLKGKKLAADKICIRDGDESIRDEYEGYWTISANSREKPFVLDGSGKRRINSEEENKIYAGCRVNAKINLWFQNNQYGKRVNATLLAIQFARDDDALASHVSEEEAIEGFDATEDDDFDDIPF